MTLTGEFLNGCDGFIESLLWMDWSHCCRAHDIAYTAGGESFDRLQADFILGQCVWLEAGPVGPLMAVACAVFGWIFFRYSSLKGKNLYEILRESHRGNSEV